MMRAQYIHISMLWGTIGFVNVLMPEERVSVRLAQHSQTAGWRRWAGRRTFFPDINPDLIGVNRDSLKNFSLRLRKGGSSQRNAP